MKIHRDLLLSALKVPLSALGTGDFGANLKFQPEDGALLICGTDSVVYAWQRIVCDHDLTEPFCTKGKPLADLLAAMPSVELDFAVEFPRLTIKAKGSRYSLPITDAAPFPPHLDESIPALVTIETDNFRMALEATNWIAPEGSQHLGYLDGLCLRAKQNSILFAAALRNYMSAHTMSGLPDIGEWDCLVPRKHMGALPKLLSGETTSLLPTKNSLRIMWGNAGYLVQQIEVKAPPYEQMLGKERTHQYEVNRAELMSVCKRILAISQIKSESRPVVLVSFSDGELNITAPESGIGDAAESIEASGGDDVSFNIDLGFIYSALPHILGDNLHWYVYQDQLSYFVGSASPDSVFLLMGVRTNG
jgi:DNA polymerase III sliding clamp (beta) subunit (PCNA family)